MKITVNCKLKSLKTLYFKSRENYRKEIMDKNEQLRSAVVHTCMHTCPHMMYMAELVTAETDRTWYCVIKLAK